MSETEKIFLLGMPKTGLSSIKSALHSRGYRVTGSPSRVYGKTHDEVISKVKAIRRLIPSYDVFCDLPWGLEYEWIYRNVPNSVFLLTIREKESWANSYIAQFEGQTSVFHRIALGPASESGERRDLILKYDEFNRSVAEFFRGSDRLSVLKSPQELKWENLGSPLDETWDKARYRR